MPLTHLRCDDIPTDEFGENELIYRRFPITEPLRFLQMKSVEFLNGISVNRELFSKPEDALFSIDNDELCTTIQKLGIIEKCVVTQLGEDDMSGINVICIKSGFRCNKAHCDITFERQLDPRYDKDKIIHLKNYLNSRFQDTGFRREN
jgi:hypothetical protein